MGFGTIHNLIAETFGFPLVAQKRGRIEYPNP
jgi:hypothetical protein